MHIAIDGRELVGKPTGVGRYLTGVLQAWAAAGIGDDVSVVLPAEPPASSRALSERFRWVVEPAEQAGTWWEQTRLRTAVRRLAPDALFAPGYTAPLYAGCPTAVLVHDVSFWAHPEWFPPREGLRRRWLTRASARQADAVLTVSEFSKAEIVRWLGVPAERITLAPPGAPPHRDVGESSRPPVVLSVGSLFNRRRVPDLLAGFAHAAARVPDARLVLIGDNRTAPRQDPRALARDLGLASRFEWHEWVDDAALERWYGQARVFAFLSDYEGFGMTPLEAMAHGVPPVVLDTPVAREVYGEGARRVPPDPVAIGEALATLLADPDAHRARVAAGAETLKRFSWSHTAETVRATLERIAGR